MYYDTCEMNKIGLYKLSDQCEHAITGQLLFSDFDRSTVTTHEDEIQETTEVHRHNGTEPS